ncbi:hypothetical protein Y1Q_0007330 [Alligator mississippiensis]|uniref:Uncharacterized protein n=1 Tax=Alligator mississippiensis TaxID=8496 RepID=A0A151P7Z6_ALLMI|nr:hypothetical protein Y1Q_0007330 [Alligator mississippiensis]
MVTEEQVVDSWAWCMGDFAHEWEGDDCNVERDSCKAARDQEFRDRLLALEERHLDAQEMQAALVAWVVETKEKDCQVLDTILALVLTFMPLATLLPATDPPAPL